MLLFSASCKCQKTRENRTKGKVVKKAIGLFFVMHN